MLYLKPLTLIGLASSLVVIIFIRYLMMMMIRLDVQHRYHRSLGVVRPDANTLLPKFHRNFIDFGAYNIKNDRIPIYTYFIRPSTPNHIFMEQLAMMRLWLRAWWSAGYAPQILVPAGTKSDSDYQKQSHQKQPHQKQSHQKQSQQPINGSYIPDDINRHESPESLLWMAFRNQGGGWLMNYDVFPLSPMMGGQFLPLQVPLPGKVMMVDRTLGTSAVLAYKLAIEQIVKSLTEPATDVADITNATDTTDNAIDIVDVIDFADRPLDAIEFDNLEILKKRGQAQNQTIYWEELGSTLQRKSFSSYLSAADIPTTLPLVSFSRAYYKNWYGKVGIGKDDRVGWASASMLLHNLNRQNIWILLPPRVSLDPISGLVCSFDRLDKIWRWVQKKDSFINLKDQKSTIWFPQFKTPACKLSYVSQWPEEVPDWNGRSGNILLVGYTASLVGRYSSRTRLFLQNHIEDIVPFPIDDYQMATLILEYTIGFMFDETLEFQIQNWHSNLEEMTSYQSIYDALHQKMTSTIQKILAIEQQLKLVTQKEPN